MAAGFTFIGRGARPQVHLGQVGKGEMKRLRKLAARGSRGTARGRGGATPKSPSTEKGGTDQ